jgi:hypothetical protein
MTSSPYSDRTEISQYSQTISYFLESIFQRLSHGYLISLLFFNHDQSYFAHILDKMDTVSYNEAMTMLDSGAYELVVYNACYGGGPNLSEKGKQLFDTLLRDQPGASRNLLEFKVANELGVQVASGRYSQFAFALVRNGLEKYVDWNEYDGLERPEVSLSRMVMGEVKRVLEEKGVLTKEEYTVIESADIGLTDVEL